MLSAKAHVPTSRASRYLTQLCSHGDQMGQRALHLGRGHGDGHAPPKVEHAEWSDTQGVIDFGWGRCVLRADSDGLALQVEAADRQDLLRIKDSIARRLERIGRRDELAVIWQDWPTPP